MCFFYSFLCSPLFFQGANGDLHVSLSTMGAQTVHASAYGTFTALQEKKNGAGQGTSPQSDTPVIYPHSSKAKCNSTL